MSEIRYDIKGPGMVCAIQAAVRAKKDITIVTDRDASGRPIRVGCFFKKKGEKIDAARQKITWFDPREIEIVPQETSVREFREACLNVEFTHDRDREWYSILNLQRGEENRVVIRTLFRVHRNSVVGFVIQAEVRDYDQGAEQYRPVIRYDCAHGFFHRDMLGQDGAQTKHDLDAQDAKTAISFAIGELQRNLNVWLQEMGHKPLPHHSMNQPKVIEEFERARSDLLYLFDHPEKMSTMKTRFVQLKDTPDSTFHLLLPKDFDPSQY